MSLNRLCRFIFLITVLIALLLLYNAWSIYRYSQVDETRAADCAIVAGAGVQGDSPTPVFQERLNHAISLYQQGTIKKLILTGGYSKGASFSDAEIARRYALSRGVPPQQMAIEEHSTVTRENLRNAKKLMKTLKLQTALIVSDPLHMQRIMLIAADNDIHGWSSPTPTSRYKTLSAQLPFLLRESFYYTGYLILRLLPTTPV